MPDRQKLLGIWLLLLGLTFFGCLTLATWLDAQWGPSPPQRLILWSLSGLPALFMLIFGLWVEIRLLRPLRHFQVLLTRINTHPEAEDDFPPQGWLTFLQKELDQLRLSWRKDRIRLRQARIDGAKDAARIRHELEALLKVLKTPLLLCDQHQRLLLFNPAAEQLFADNPALGLGRRLNELLPSTSLTDALRHLPRDGSPRQLLVPCQDRWLLADLRRVMATQGEALLTLEDATARQHMDQRWKKPLAGLLPALRGHAANLATAGEVLSSGAGTPDLTERLQRAMLEDSQALSELVTELAHLLESLHQAQGQLSDTWSNDVWQALIPALESHQIQLTPLGIPAWMQADTPALLALLQRVLLELARTTEQTHFESDIQLGNDRVYLDLIWSGEPIGYKTLQNWQELPVSEEPMSPRLGDLLRRHASDWWSLTDTGSGQARLRIPLPAATRVYPPAPLVDARPEFHDFSIADLPAPSAALGELRLDELEIVVFDTETTGLKLRDGDQIISLGACRILRGRLLAQENFDQKVNPKRPIPHASTLIHGITDQDVEEAPPIEVVLPRFREFIGHGVLLAHNAAFDLLAINLAGQDSGQSFTMPVLDTLLLSRGLDPEIEGHGLDNLAERFNLTFPPGTRHTALGDARVTAELFLTLLPRLEARGIVTLSQALELQKCLQKNA